jgi:hypothetical protein
VAEVDVRQRRVLRQIGQLHQFWAMVQHEATKPQRKTADLAQLVALMRVQFLKVGAFVENRMKIERTHSLAPIQVQKSQPLDAEITEVLQTLAPAQVQDLLSPAYASRPPGIYFLPSRHSFCLYFQ